MTTPDTDWGQVLLPDDVLHPMAFLRPDTVLHVHDLWQAGRHMDTAVRQFGIRDASQVPHIATFGIDACIEYVAGWGMDSGTVAALQVLPSLQRLEAGFWTYLESLTRFQAAMSAVPEGGLLFNGEAELVPVIRIEGPSGMMALVAQGIASVLDFTIGYSAVVDSHNAGDPDGMFFRAERELHPFWSRLAARIEYALTRHPLTTDPKSIWIWIDQKRHPDRMNEAKRNAHALQRRGFTITLLTPSPLP